MIDPEKENKTIKLFKRKKTMTVQELSMLMDCSIPTIRKRLTQWRVYTSYNKNGRYYVCRKSQSLIKQDYGITGILDFPVLEP